MANPWLLWAEVARKNSEMLWASSQVITHRVSRMAAAGSRPSARDRKEFTLMGAEKIGAAQASAMAVGMLAWQQWWSMWATSWAMPRTGKGMLRAANRASARNARMAQAALGPYQRGAGANARRLARPKP